MEWSGSSGDTEPVSSGRGVHDWLGWVLRKETLREI